MKSKLLIAVVTTLLFLLPSTVFAHSDANTSVEVDMVDTKGQPMGKAIISSGSEGVEIHLKAKGLTPGVHAIHIHENGECAPPDFKTAGAHFNPTNAKHGFDNPDGFHSGDLPNIEVGQDGTVDVKITTQAVTLKKGEKNSLLKKNGTALIIHEKADDYVTDPAGDAGARIACGVIK